MATPSQSGLQTESQTKSQAKKLAENIQVEAFVEGALVDVPGIAIAQYQTWLTLWLAELSPALSPLNAYELSLRLTTDAEIQQLNTDYRHQSKPTDVLSFAALETDLPGADALNQEQPLYLGDIIISVETAERQAKACDRSLSQEVIWLAAHGLLHLLGWDHPDEPSLISMLDKQDHLLALIEED
ncbi:MAG: rRNA maturation RNase YbeY [Phormidesmis sp.]